MTEHDMLDREKQEDFGDTVARKAARKHRARRREDRGIWFGLGAFGIVGWSVAIPALIGVFLGVWIDNRWPGPVPWTLVLLLLGLALGCFNAWRWLSEELEDMDQDREEHRDE